MQLCQVSGRFYKKNYFDQRLNIYYFTLTARVARHAFAPGFGPGIVPGVVPGLGYGGLQNGFNSGSSGSQATAQAFSNSNTQNFGGGITGRK